MDTNQLVLSGGAGVALEPFIEHAIMKYIPAKLSALKPFIAWLIATAWGIFQAYSSGGDWKQGVGNTISTIVVMELKHQSPWGANATNG